MHKSLSETPRGGGGYSFIWAMLVGTIPKGTSHGSEYPVGTPSFRALFIYLSSYLVSIIYIFSKFSAPTIAFLAF